MASPSSPRPPSSPFKPGLRLAVLHADWLCADMIKIVLHRMLPEPEVLTFHRLADFAASSPRLSLDLLVTGLAFEDGTVLELIKALPLTRRTVRRMLVITAQHDAHVVTALVREGVSGLFDPATEGASNLETAIAAVLQEKGYWSQASTGSLARQIRITAQGIRLTKGEVKVLLVVGEGADNNEAARRLGLAPSTIDTVRRTLHRKLGVHQRSELMRVAVQLGYVKLGVLKAPGAA